MNNLCVCLIINNDIYKDLAILKNILIKIKNCIVFDFSDNKYSNNIEILDEYTKIFDTWKNYEYNMNIIFNNEFMFDFIWIYNINDIIINFENIDLLNLNINNDVYYLKYYKNNMTISDVFMDEYWKESIFNVKYLKNWCINGKYFLKYISKNTKYIYKKIYGDYYIYNTNDININEKILIINTEMYSLGEFLYDKKDYINSLKYFLKYIEICDNNEEKYSSYIRLGDIYVQLNKNFDEIYNMYLNAYKLLEYRGEALHRICCLCRKYNKYDIAYEYSKKGTNLKYPENDLLFINKYIYDLGFWDELGISSYYIKEYQESYDCYLKIEYKSKEINFNQNNIYYNENIKRILANKIFTYEVLKTKNIKIGFYIGHIINGNIINYVNILISRYNYADIFIVDTMNNISHIECNKINKNIMINMLNDNYLDILFHICDCGLLCYDDTNNNINKYTKHFLLIDNFDDYFKFLFCDNSIKAYLNEKNILIYMFKKLNGFISPHNKYLLEKYNINNIYNFDIYADYYKINKKINFNNNFYDISNEIILKYPNNIKNLFEKTDKYLNCMKQYIYDDIFNIFNIHNNLQFFNSNKIKNINEFSEELLQLISNHFSIYNENITKQNINISEILDILNNHNMNNKYDKEQIFLLLRDHIKLNIFNDENEKKNLEKIKDELIINFKDKYLIYPKNIIDNIKKYKSKKKILFTITTCKRFDLFEKTMNSFLNCCLDINLIHDWICIDDNSLSEDRFKMEQLYPFFTFIWKDNYQKGHIYSMNMIHDLICSHNYDYLVHLEDDFHFFEKRDYLSESIKILEYDTTLGQVLFNKNYLEIEPYKLDIIGGTYKTIDNKLRYIEHLYDVNKKCSALNQYYYPHFSFRPSVHRCSTWKDIGIFYNTNFFEYAYALEYIEKKYKSAFIDTFCCIHIGKKTWESGLNAYNMNNVNQFVFDIDKFNICIIKTDNESWKIFKTKMRNTLSFVRYYNSHIECISDILIKCQDEKNKFSKFLIMEDIAQFDFNIEKKINRIMNKILDINGLIIAGHNNAILEVLNEPILFKIDDITKYDFHKISYICDYNIIKNIKETHNITNDNVYELFMKYDDIYIIDNPIITYKKNEYIFMKNFDSYSYDNGYIDAKQHTLNDMINICNNNYLCVGFNTLGFYKYIIKPKDEFIKLSNTDGLYINKDKWIHNDDNAYILKNNIEKIKNKNNDIIKNNLTFTVTTCKRWDYFRYAMDNFIIKCQDIEIFDRWICIDDNSSNEDKQNMLKRYPFFKFIWKTNDQKGHAKSMNILWDIIETKYLFHFEDDWLMFNEFKIHNFFQYMKNNCDQLIFVKQIGEHTPKLCEIDDYNIHDKICNPIHYMKPNDNLKYDAHNNFRNHDKHKNKKYLKNQYWWWPGFSLNPSLLDFHKISQNVGEFINNDKIFEYDYAVRCYINDIKINIVNFNVSHIGIISSYTLQ